MLTFDIKWIAPIRVGLFADDLVAVEGPMQALALLQEDWPSAGGKHHQAAMQECRLACQEFGRSEKAREAFMAAALEAGNLIFAQRKVKLPHTAVPAKRETAKGHALPM